MDHNTLRRMAKEFLDEAQAIQAKASEESRLLTAEEAAKVDELIQKAEEHRAAADRAYRLETTASVVPEHGNTPGGAPASEPPSGGRMTAPDSIPSSGDVPAQPRDQEAEARHNFDSFGDFALAVRAAGDPARPGALDERLNLGAAASGLSQSVGSDGGFLVPPTFSQTIWDGLRDELDNFMARCDEYTVTGESISFPKVDESSRKTGSRYGGIRSYWIAEGSQIPASQPKLEGLRLEPQELATLVFVTEKLLRNAGPAISQYLTRAATEEIRFMVNNAIYEGDGTGKPLGIKNSPALITVSKDTGQAGDSVTERNIARMWARLHPRARQGAVWLANVDVEPALDLLSHVIRNAADDDNVGGSYARLYNPETGTLKGRPVIYNEHSDTLGDPGDLMLVHFPSYALGVRGGIRSDTSMHLRFDYAEMAFRFMFEIDGKPWLDKPITPFKGAETLSTFVQLEARA